MGLGHATRAFLHRPGEPIATDALRVKSMQVRQMKNIVDAVLDRSVIHRPDGKDVSGHEARDGLLGLDPTIHLHEPELQVELDRLVEPAYVRLVAGARRILEELNVSDTSKTDLVESPQRVGVVSDVPYAFGDVGIFEDGFESLAIVGRRGEGRFSEDKDVDQSHYLLWVDENSDEGDSPISAERLPFEIQVESTGRRDRGKKSFQFRQRRDERWGWCSGGHVDQCSKRMAVKNES